MRGGTLESSGEAGSREGTKERGEAGAEPRVSVRGTGERGRGAKERNSGAESGACPGRGGAERGGALKFTGNSQASQNQFFGGGPCRPWLHSRSMLLVFDPT